MTSEKLDKKTGRFLSQGSGFLGLQSSLVFNGLRFFSYGSVIATYALIVIGGFVAGSNSGEACPDWPTCNGQVIPALTGSVLIEFSHRLATVLAVGFILSTFILAWKAYRDSRGVLLFSSLALLLVVTQALLGMVVVRSGLDAAVVAAHLGLATAVFGAVLVNAILVRNVSRSVKILH